MSSLDQEEADKQLQRAVPWVSDPQNREQLDSETRRLQEDVIEAAKRLEREAVTFLPPAEPGNALGLRPSTARLREEGRASHADGLGSEEQTQKIWDQLRPQFITAPPQDGLGLRNLVLVASFLAAMAMSAIVALVVVNIAHPPTIISADVKSIVKSEERVAKGNLLAALGDFARISETQAKMTHADESAIPTENLLASAQPDDIAASKPAAALPPRTARVEPPQREITAPAADPAPAAKPVPEPPRATPLPQDEVAALLKRGRDLIAAGDIASARLILTLVAEAGNAEACFTLAGTFDPAVLARLQAIGVRADPAKAQTWYERAAEQGSLEARQRLQALR